MPSAIRLPQLASAKHIWKSFDTFLFDADGVLWREQYALDGAIQLVHQLISAGKQVMIVTNNSTRDSAEHAAKCAKMGFTGLTADNIVASGVILVHYINKLKAKAEYRNSAHLPVYLVGSVGLQRLLKRNGIESFGPGSDPLLPADPEQEFNFDHANHYISRQPVFSVVGAFDAHISYPKVVKAVNYLSNPETPFLVTNEDAVFPGAEPGTLIPGAGTVTSVLRCVSGREPIVMGKPSRTCWEYICEQFPGKIDPDRIIMVGDRCDTDILFGHNSGLTTLLVLTGVTTMSEVEQFAGQGKATLVPDFYVPTLSHLLAETSTQNE